MFLLLYYYYFWSCLPVVLFLPHTRLGPAYNLANFHLKSSPMATALLSAFALLSATAYLPCIFQCLLSLYSPALPTTWGSPPSHVLRNPCEAGDSPAFGTAVTPSPFFSIYAVLLQAWPLPHPSVPTACLFHAPGIQGPSEKWAFPGTLIRFQR